MENNNQAPTNQPAQLPDNNDLQATTNQPNLINNPVTSQPSNAVSTQPAQQIVVGSMDTKTSESNILSSTGVRASTKSSKMNVFLIIGLIIILIIGGGLYWALNHKSNKPTVSNNSGQLNTSSSSGYETAINSYITAFQNNNKSAADALQSIAFITYLKTGYPSGSYYSICQSSGQVCTDYFSKQYLSLATKKTSSYTSKSGVKGFAITYTVTTPGSNTATESVSSSSSSLTLDAIPSGNTWLIDNISST